MSDDDYVAELRSHGMLSTNQAADRIETLTAQLESTLKDRKLILEERDRTFALMLARAEKAEAERDRLREALQQFLIEYDEVDLADAEPSSLTAAVLSARAALKGESHD